MRYWPPRNQPANAPWQNGNPSTGERGSVIEARAIEHPQREITNTISRFGLTPDENDLEQLGKAIENKIQSSTGGGSTESFATLATLRSKLRFYPETTTADGRLAISSPSDGTIFVAATGSVVHRSIFEHIIGDIPEVDRIFPTLPNKVYHLRQNLNSGALSLRDVSDSEYNPGGLAEENTAFDSTFDNAMHARIVTNSSNVAEITSLINRSQLSLNEMVEGTDGVLVGANGSNWLVNHFFGWGRRPARYTLTVARKWFNSGDTDFNIFDPTGINRSSTSGSNNPFAVDPEIPLTRYELAAAVMDDNTTGLIMHFSASA